jgi:hypothetical protein
MRDALRAYLRFAGADRLAWAPHLLTEERLFPGPVPGDQVARTHHRSTRQHAASSRTARSATSFPWMSAITPNRTPASLAGLGRRQGQVRSRAVFPGVAGSCMTSADGSSMGTQWVKPRNRSST